MTTLAPCRRVPWRWLVDSPLVLATWAAVLLGTAALRDLDAVLGESAALRSRAEGCLGRLAAESALADMPASAGAPAPFHAMVGEVAVSVHAVGKELLVRSDLPSGGSWQFECTRLAGAAPAGFGVARTFGALPVLDPDQVAAAFPASEVPAFRRDPGIGLRHLEAGTERDDFVLDGERASRGLGIEAPVIVVQGHLWIEPGDQPLCLRLSRDVTIVVRGNLYVGRSVVLDGPGRVVFVAVPDAQARAFADRDGNGRWSVGDVVFDGPFRGVIEGAGSAFLGLERVPQPLAFAGGLAVAGELHVAAAVRVEGPVLVGHGMTTRGGGSLVAVGARLFQTEREAVPGFAVTGGPRPGLLRAVPRNRGGARDETLYLAAPSR